MRVSISPSGRDFAPSRSPEPIPGLDGRLRAFGPRLPIQGTSKVRRRPATQPHRRTAHRPLPLGDTVEMIFYEGRRTTSVDNHTCALEPLPARSRDTSRHRRRPSRNHQQLRTRPVHRRPGLLRSERRPPPRARRPRARHRHSRVRTARSRRTHQPRPRCTHDTGKHECADPPQPGWPTPPTSRTGEPSRAWGSEIVDHPEWWPWVVLPRSIVRG
jgi:hypothetical protein